MKNLRDWNFSVPGYIYLVSLSLHCLQEVDLAVAPFVFTPSRAKAVQFLFPLEEAEHSFIIKVPTENTLTMYLRPFQVTGLFFVKWFSKMKPN